MEVAKRGGVQGVRNTAGDLFSSKAMNDIGDMSKVNWAEVTDSLLDD